MSTLDVTQPDFEDGLLCFDPFLEPLFQIRPTDFINDNYQEFFTNQNIEPPIPCVADMMQEGDQEIQPEEMYYPTFRIPNPITSSHIFNRYKCHNFPIVKYENFMDKFKDMD